MPLLDFCIGHRLILLKQRNPFLWMEESDFNNIPFEKQCFWLIESVYTCAQSHAFRRRFESGSVGHIELWWHRRKVSSWHRRRKRECPKRADSVKDYWAVEIAKFRNYLNLSRVIEDFNARREGFPFLPTNSMPNSDGRALGGPYDAALIQFLTDRLGVTEAQAFEYPLARAQIHYLTWLEREGNLRILNATEMEFRENNAMRDLEAAKTAGFNTVQEHYDHVLSENKAEKLKKEQATTAKT